MKFNTNEMVEVELTAHGANVYNRYYGQYPIEYRPAEKKEGEILKDQLWHLFSVFGPHMFLGGMSPFKDCIINLGGNK